MRRLASRVSRLASPGSGTRLRGLALSERRPRVRAGARVEGFTLVELLVVITIIVVLAGIMFPVVLKMQGQGDKAVCASLIQQLEVSIGVYEGHFGDFPPSDWDGFARVRHGDSRPFSSVTKPSNSVNTGIEVLMACLTAEVGGLEPFEWKEEQLENFDGDKLEGVPGWKLAKKLAYEIVDPWGFPLVYIHNRDYGKKFKIQGAEGETREVEAQKGDKVGWQRRRSYQLFSLGPDGQLGTSDDIRTW